MLFYHFSMSLSNVRLSTEVYVLLDMTAWRCIKEKMTDHCITQADWKPKTSLST